MKPAGNVFDDIAGVFHDYDPVEIRECDYWIIGGVKWVMVGKKENHVLVARADEPKISVICDVNDFEN